MYFDTRKVGSRSRGGSDGEARAADRQQQQQQGDEDNGRMPVPVVQEWNIVYFLLGARWVRFGGI